jgi:OOP family OmpA-OmpF porin
MVRPLLASLLLVGCITTPAPVAPASTPTPPPSATRDFDGDGFMDPQDRCPREAGPAPFGCPELDSDGDRVADSKDSCPKTAGTTADGCADADRDGVGDQTDPCPDKAETRNGYLDKDGCPDDPPKDLSRLTGVVKGVQFELDKDVLKPSSFAALDRAVKTLNKYPEVRIEISAHTDNTGNADYGRVLSPRRAQAVKQYLVDHGIDEKRLETRGAGPDEPIDTNKTAAGRARNRRIEFTLLVD